MNINSLCMSRLPWKNEAKPMCKRRQNGTKKTITWWKLHRQSEYMIKKPEYVNELLGPGADGNDGTYHDLYLDDHNTKKAQVLRCLSMIHTHQYTLKCELSIIIQVQVEMSVNYYAILARGEVMDV